MMLICSIITLQNTFEQKSMFANVQLLAKWEQEVWALTSAALFVCLRPRPILFGAGPLLLLPGPVGCLCV